LRGSKDGVASGVVDGDAKQERPPAAGGHLGSLDRPLQGGAEPVPPADDLQPHAVGYTASDFAAQVLGEEPHQPGDFDGRPAPVVAGERVKRQCPHPGFGGGLHGPANRSRAGPVPRTAREPLPLGPPPVAIHDDADVEPGRRRERSSLCHKVDSQKKRVRQRSRVLWISASMWSR
jgi:hypothetical protein